MKTETYLSELISQVVQLGAPYVLEHWPRHGTHKDSRIAGTHCLHLPEFFIQSNCWKKILHFLPFKISLQINW